jgi:hypothetical protein
MTQEEFVLALRKAEYESAIAKGEVDISYELDGKRHVWHVGCLTSEVPEGLKAELQRVHPGAKLLGYKFVSEADRRGLINPVL